MNLKELNRKNGYSMLEVIVSLAITAVSVFMMMNILIVGFKLNIESLSKSYVREEVTNLSSLILRDIRNADRVTDCGTLSFRKSCEFVRAGKFRWGECPDDDNKICKIKIDDEGTEEIVFESPPNLVFNIDFILTAEDSEFTPENVSVLLTIVGNHIATSASGVNVISQISITTRNFTRIPYAITPLPPPMCPTQNLDCGSSQVCTFLEIQAGSSRTSVCPEGYDGNPSRICNNGVWGELSGSCSIANNLFTNPTFTTNNLGWSFLPVSGSSTPSGWIPVPGNSLYGFGNSAFLVMKYEAKCANASSPTIGLTTPTNGSVNVFRDDQASCVQGSYDNRVVVSLPGGFPIAFTTLSTATNRCQSINLGSGVSVNLISNNQWMNIARDMETVDSNWSLGQVGSGYLYAGHVDTQPNTPKIASSSDLHRCAYTDSAGSNQNPALCPTNTAAGSATTVGNQVRTLRLSNGEIIWDFAGNMREWTTQTVTAIDQPDTSGWGGFSWRQFTQITGWGPLGRDAYAPFNTSFGSNQGMGKIFSDSNSTGSTIYALIRGGFWNDDQTNPGIFASVMNNLPTASTTNIGFRCTTNSFSLSQTHSATAGRSGGGANSLQVAVNALMDGKLVQNVNIPLAGNYELSLYYYSASQLTTESKPVLMYNGSNMTSFTENLGGGWYRLSANLDATIGLQEFGVRIKSGTTIIVDDMKLVEGLICEPGLC